MLAGQDGKVSFGLQFDRELHTVEEILHQLALMAIPLKGGFGAEVLLDRRPLGLLVMAQEEIGYGTKALFFGNPKHLVLQLRLLPNILEDNMQIALPEMLKVPQLQLFH